MCPETVAANGALDARRTRQHAKLSTERPPKRAPALGRKVGDLVDRRSQLWRGLGVLYVVASRGVGVVAYVVLCVLVGCVLGNGRLVVRSLPESQVASSDLKRARE